MAVYTVKDYIALIAPYTGTRGYKLMLRIATEDNMYDLADVVIADSVERGGGAVTPPS